MGARLVSPAQSMLALEQLRQDRRARSHLFLAMQLVGLVEMSKWLSVLATAWTAGMSLCVLAHQLQLTVTVEILSCLGVKVHHHRVLMVVTVVQFG
jgi:hypothetical protein